MLTSESHIHCQQKVKLLIFMLPDILKSFKGSGKCGSVTVRVSSALSLCFALALSDCPYSSFQLPVVPVLSLPLLLSVYSSSLVLKMHTLRHPALPRLSKIPSRLLSRLSATVTASLPPISGKRQSLFEVRLKSMGTRCAKARDTRFCRHRSLGSWCYLHDLIDCLNFHSQEQISVRRLQGRYQFSGLLARVISPLVYYYRSPRMSFAPSNSTFQSF